MELKSFTSSDLRAYRLPQDQKDAIVRGLESLYDTHLAKYGDTPGVSQCKSWQHQFGVEVIVSLHGLVYDQSPFIFQHPGGASSLLVTSGTDASSIFEAVGHTMKARAMLSRFIIGRMIDDLVDTSHTGVFSPSRKTALQRKMELLQIEEMKRAGKVGGNISMKKSTPLQNPAMFKQNLVQVDTQHLEVSQEHGMYRSKKESIPDILNLSDGDDVSVFEETIVSEQNSVDDQVYVNVNNNVVITPRKKQVYIDEEQTLVPKTPIYDRTPKNSRTPVRDITPMDDVYGIPICDVSIELGKNRVREGSLQNKKQNESTDILDITHSLAHNITEEELDSSDSTLYEHSLYANTTHNNTLDDSSNYAYYDSSNNVNVLSNYSKPSTLSKESNANPMYSESNNINLNTRVYDTSIFNMNVAESPSLAHRTMLQATGIQNHTPIPYNLSSNIYNISSNVDAGHTQSYDVSNTSGVQSNPNIVISPPRTYHAPTQYGDIRQRTQFVFPSPLEHNETVYITPHGTPTKHVQKK